MNETPPKPNRGIVIKTVRVIVKEINDDSPPILARPAEQQTKVQVTPKPASGCGGCGTAEENPPEASMELRQDTPTHVVKEILKGKPPAPLPKGWFGFPGVVEGFRQLFDEASKNVPPPPRWEADRGIVICGGGWKFFPSLYVTVRMIRHVGCELPIQVWYLGDRGEFDVRMLWALEPWGVGWIDADAFCRDNNIPRRRPLEGWPLKPLAAAYCPYREVISLDADSYPVYNPDIFMAHPEFQRVGASFWPDNGQRLERGQWERFGVAYHDEPAWESGQFIVDKGRHWGPLWLTTWFNDYSDYVYHHVYGDKDTFHFCWRKMGHEVCVPTARAGWHQVAFLQKDFSGKTLFVHRTRDKFRWAGSIDGLGVENHYSTKQNTNAPLVIPALPLEAIAHGFCTQSSELLRPELHFHFREGCWDRDIWSDINLKDEYLLPRSFKPSDVIVDVGAHIGSFANACLTRGAGMVYCVEPDPGNLVQLRKNLEKWHGRAVVLPVAVWDEPTAMLAPPREPGNTGGSSVVRPGGWLPVDTMPLRRILAIPGKRIKLLKLDCEGAEWHILKDTDLSMVDTVCGEAHDGKASDLILQHMQPRFDWWEYKQHTDPALQLFWAGRREG